MEVTKPKPGRKPGKINKAKLKEQLFVSINGSENIKNSLLHLFKDIQKINPGIASAKQIRKSTIIYWLKNDEPKAGAVHGRAQMRELDRTLPGPTTLTICRAGWRSSTR